MNNMMNCQLTEVLIKIYDWGGKVTDPRGWSNTNIISPHFKFEDLSFEKTLIRFWGKYVQIALKIR